MVCYIPMQKYNFFKFSLQMLLSAHFFHTKTFSSYITCFKNEQTNIFKTLVQTEIKIRAHEKVLKRIKITGSQHKNFINLEQRG